MNFNFQIPEYGGVYKRLLISFVILVLLSTLIVSFFSFVYFSNILKKELDGANSTITNNIKNKLDEEIFYKTICLSSDITLNTHLYKNINDCFNINIINYPEKIVNSVFTLRNIVSNNEKMINSIYIFSKNNNLLLSSEGFSFMDNDSYIQQLDTSWLNAYENYKNNNMFWTSQRKNKQGESILTFVRTYPFVFPMNTGFKGLIAINVKISSIEDIIDSAPMINDSNLFIVTDLGRIISSGNCEINNQKYINEADLENILATTISNKIFVKKINNQKYVIQHIPFSNIKDWNLCSVTPYKNFYNKAYIMYNALTILCIFTILFGIIVSFSFASRIYNPISFLLSNARKELSDPNCTNNREQDEFEIINNAINFLSTKIKELNETLDNNMPLIKYGIINRLLSGSIKDEKEFKQLTKFFNGNLMSAKFIVFIAQLSSNIIRGMDIKNSMFVKYDIINYVEKINLDSGKLFAIDLHDNKIAILLISNKIPDLFQIEKISNSVFNHIDSTSKIPCAISVSECTSNPFLINILFERANDVIKFKLLFPQKRLFYVIDYVKRMFSNLEIPNNILSSFKTSLHTNNVEEVDNSLNILLFDLQNRHYSIETCYTILKNISDIVINYAKNIDEIIYERVKEDLNQAFRDLIYVTDFLQLVKMSSINIFKYQQEKINLINRQKVEKVKQYITENIGSDFSLDTLADLISITPQYLSILFKEHCGINYQDYTTKLKMEKARELLYSTGMTISEISYYLGYKNPSYFIYQFKKEYGLTPGNFKLINDTDKSIVNS